MTHHVRVSIMVALLFSAGLSLKAQVVENDTALANKVDDYLKSELSSKRIPGMSVCVVRDGKVIFAKGYGFANIELSATATQETIYEVASLTKPFTATAIMMLVEEGRISLEDPLSKYFPGAPETWGKITIRHLLSHTSGLSDFFSIPALRSESGFAWDREYKPEELLRVLFQASLQTQPGEKWSYSNLGYYLLGFIIEKVAGDTYEQFLRRRIFQPLQMPATRRMSRKDVIQNRATGYTWDHNVLRNAAPTSVTWAYSEGGLVSSVSDLAKADAGLFTPKLLNKTTLEQMWSPTRLNDGTIARYGFGWNIASDPGRRQIYHSGNKPGFFSIIRHYVDDHLTVVLLANADSGLDVGAISFHVAAFYLSPAGVR